MDSVNLANNLKKLRVEHNLTQAKLAELIGVTRKTINTIENKVFVPSTILALKLAEVFQVKVEDIFTLTTRTSKETGTIKDCSNTKKLENTDS